MPNTIAGIDKSRYVLWEMEWPEFLGERPMRKPLDNEVYNLDGIGWSDAPCPPRKHKCWPQTVGYMGLDTVYRCACGGIKNPRFGNVEYFEKNSRDDAPAEVEDTPQAPVVDEQPLTGMALHRQVWREHGRFFAAIFAAALVVSFVASFIITAVTS